MGARGLGLAMILALVGITPTFAFAHQPFTGTDILLPQSPAGINEALGRGEVLPANLEASTDAKIAEFTAGHPGRWRTVSWNPVTLTPRLVTGTGWPTGAAVRDAGRARSVALAFIESSNVLWGVSAVSLEAVFIRRVRDKWTVSFRQTLDGRPVLGSRLTVVVTDRGRVFAFGGDLWPDLRAAETHETYSQGMRARAGS